jgi:hypothetical protein
MLDDARTWLQKTGFPFEMRVADVFEAAGFEVRQGLYYTDPVTRLPREADVVATMLDTSTHNRVVRFDVCVECKWTKAPWIGLRRGDRVPDVAEWRPAMQFNAEGRESATLVASPLVVPAEAPAFAIRQKGDTEPSEKEKRKKEGEGRDTPYSAITQANALAHARVGDPTVPGKDLIATILLSIPVIVIPEGMLLTAHINAGNVEVRSAGRVLLGWTMQPKTSHLVAVNVVTEDQLAAFAQDAQLLCRRVLHAATKRTTPNF